MSTELVEKLMIQAEALRSRNKCNPSTYFFGSESQWWIIYQYPRPPCP
ncbi:hypothetical protein PROFUN_08585 [Planoprotostelium fungivorum]|uniref:Uncharacterized protein n=1 Tax=Planoprotostelium fungivorum TaxID=1890364 RepID=A0A2P6NJ48_9EUKA|nr:hypothetical protein PROFUN_08585 [Planoprotostelium fungivorum]